MTCLTYIYRAGGKIVQELTIIPTQRPHGYLALPCQPLCGLNLHRPHLTCLNCRTRKAYYKKQDTIKIWYSFTVTIKKGTPWWKRQIIKMLTTIIVFLAG